MSFETLRELKAIAKQINEYGLYKVDFYYPSMFIDGHWSVNIVFDGIVDYSVLNRFLFPLQGGKGDYFLSILGGKISMHIQ